MPSVKTMWKYRGLMWRYRGLLWRYRGVWKHRRKLIALAGVGAGIVLARKIT